jgi:hypothetical protein
MFQRAIAILIMYKQVDFAEVAPSNLGHGGKADIAIDD